MKHEITDRIHVLLSLLETGIHQYGTSICVSLHRTNLILRECFLDTETLAGGDGDLCQAGRANQLQIRHATEVGTHSRRRVLEVQGMTPVTKLREEVLILSNRKSSMK